MVFVNKTFMSLTRLRRFLEHHDQTWRNLLSYKRNYRILTMRLEGKLGSIYLILSSRITFANKQQSPEKLWFNQTGLYFLACVSGHPEVNCCSSGWGLSDSQDFSSGCKMTVGTLPINYDFQAAKKRKWRKGRRSDSWVSKANTRYITR